MSECVTEFFNHKSNILLPFFDESMKLLSNNNKTYKNLLDMYNSYKPEFRIYFEFDSFKEVLKYGSLNIFYVMIIIYGEKKLDNNIIEHYPEILNHINIYYLFHNFLTNVKSPFISSLINYLPNIKNKYFNYLYGGTCDKNLYENEYSYSGYTMIILHNYKSLSPFILKDLVTNKFPDLIEHIGLQKDQIIKPFFRKEKIFLKLNQHFNKEYISLKIYFNKENNVNILFFDSIDYIDWTSSSREYIKKNRI
jgi:hypothetical protein